MFCICIFNIVTKKGTHLTVVELISIVGGGRWEMQTEREDEKKLFIRTKEEEKSQRQTILVMSQWIRQWWTHPSLLISFLMNIICETLTANCTMETNRLIELNWPCLKSSICVYIHPHNVKIGSEKRFFVAAWEEKVLQNGVILLLLLLSGSFLQQWLVDKTEQRRNLTSLSLLMQFASSDKNT